MVSDEPGITRDRVYRLATYLDYNFQVVDTGGIIFDDSEDTFAERITQQAIIALKEANVAVMVCNGQEGVTQLDQIIADWLRKNIKIPVYIAVNKCESEKRGISMAQEFWSLGLGTPFPVSGIHGSGLAEMLDKVVTHMDKVSSLYSCQHIFIAHSAVLTHFCHLYIGEERTEREYHQRRFSRQAKRWQEQLAQSAIWPGPQHCQ
ncbi:hypothetical protein EON65_22070 [archaeon]|nr:MAG: hypothetical protein EON65_22070 [archaeon]